MTSLTERNTCPPAKPPFAHWANMSLREYYGRRTSIVGRAAAQSARVSPANWPGRCGVDVFVAPALLWLGDSVWSCRAPDRMAKIEPTLRQLWHKIGLCIDVIRVRRVLLVSQQERGQSLQGLPPAFAIGKLADSHSNGPRTTWTLVAHVKLHHHRRGFLTPVPPLAAILRGLPFICMLAGCVTLGAPPRPTPEFASLVVLGEQGAAQARVIIAAATCPDIDINGRTSPMTVRAPAATVALRKTASDPVDSKPSAFPVLTCEALIPSGSASARVLGRSLALPQTEVRRIVVIGDTGCRLKKGINTFQNCNDKDDYPFAQVARAAAAWKPDLVVHVGDYHYRENACPPGNSGCAGSSWGYGWDTWRDDFFSPSQVLLNAAPLVAGRGNHESCRRAGQGYWRFLDPRVLVPGRDCDDAANDHRGDYSEPYAVPLGNAAQLIVFDTSNVPFRALKPGDAGFAQYADTYRKLDTLSQQNEHNITVNHHPILGVQAQEKADGLIKLHGGELSLQAAFGAQQRGYLPARIDAMLAGHVHLWQQVSFSSDHPSQFVAGFSGTSEETVPLPATLAPPDLPAPGTAIEHWSSWVGGFGFMTMERTGSKQWEVKVWDRHGALRNTCQLSGRKSVCKLAHVL